MLLLLLLMPLLLLLLCLLLLAPRKRRRRLLHACNQHGLVKQQLPLQGQDWEVVQSRGRALSTVAGCIWEGSLRWLASGIRHQASTGATLALWCHGRPASQPTHLEAHPPGDAVAAGQHPWEAAAQLQPAHRQHFHDASKRAARLWGLLQQQRRQQQGEDGRLPCRAAGEDLRAQRYAPEC